MYAAACKNVLPLQKLNLPGLNNTSRSIVKQERPSMPCETTNALPLIVYAEFSIKTG